MSNEQKLTYTDTGEEVNVGDVLYYLDIRDIRKAILLQDPKPEEAFYGRLAFRVERQHRMDIPIHTLKFGSTDVYSTERALLVVIRDHNLKAAEQYTQKRASALAAAADIDGKILLIDHGVEVSPEKDSKWP